MIGQHALNCTSARLRCRFLAGRRMGFTKAVLSAVLVLAIGTATAFSQQASESVQTLVKATEDKNAQVRVKAIKALGELGLVAKSAVPALSKLLKDEDLEVRAQAAVSTWKITGAATKSMEVVIELLRGDNRRGRYHAIEAIFVMQDDAKDAAPVLCELSTKLNGFERERVVHALGYVGVQPGVIEALVSHLTDKRWEVRLHAAQSLGNLTINDPDGHTKYAVPGLIEATNDKVAVIRFISFQTLAEIGPNARPAVPRLLEALKDEKDIETCVMAAQALWRIDGQHKVVIPVLIDALKKKDGKRWAAYTLGEIGTLAKASVPFLIETLKDENEYIRETAAQALKKIDLVAAQKAGVK